MADSYQVPIFPLHTVLFPGGILPLRVFEPRYTDMISNCLRNGSSFGVCLISDGSEVGGMATTYDVGTMANIIDWHTRHDGLLGITVLGMERFSVEKTTQQANRLMLAEIETITQEQTSSIPPEFYPLVDMCRQIIEQVAYRYHERPKHFDDAAWVGYRLAELLPIKLSQKQYFLQLTDPIVRLERLFSLLQKLNLK